MQTLCISQFDKKTNQRVSVPVLEHHLLSDYRAHSGTVRVTGMLRLHDDIVNQLVGLTDVSFQYCPYRPFVSHEHVKLISGTCEDLPVCILALRSETLVELIPWKPTYFKAFPKPLCASQTSSRLRSWVHIAVHPASKQIKLSSFRQYDQKNSS